MQTLQPYLPSEGSVFLESAEVYDPKTKTWSFIAPMNVKRSRVALVANCGKLYAIGGYDGVSILAYHYGVSKYALFCHIPIR